MDKTIKTAPFKNFKTFSTNWFDSNANIQKWLVIAKGCNLKLIDFREIWQSLVSWEVAEYCNRVVYSVSTPLRDGEMFAGGNKVNG